MDQFSDHALQRVLTVASPDAPLAGKAWEKLCRSHGYPVYTFIPRPRQSPETTLDLTQECFARFLEREHVRLADPQRGRLRSFMLTSIQNFLTPTNRGTPRRSNAAVGTV